MAEEIVIVGGGIGGAVLALALGQAGIPSRILEREPAAGALPSLAFARPEILWSPTMATFQRLGVADRIAAEAALPLRGLEIHHTPEPGGAAMRLIRVDESDFEASGIRPWSTDPARTRALLLEAAVGTGQVRIEHGITVSSLAPASGGILVGGERDGSRLEVPARLVVGDDGLGSVVRRYAGIGLRATPLPMELMGAVTERPASLPAEEVRLWLNPGGLRHGVVASGFLPVPGQRVTTVLAMTPETGDRLVKEGEDAFWEAWARTAPPAAELRGKIAFPARFGRFRRPFGHADTYVADGIALIGDAAHPVTPAGGQGANMAVADAVALAGLLAERLPAGRLSAADLAPYEQARRAANERSITFSRRARQGFSIIRRLPLTLELLARWLRRADPKPEAKQAALRAVGTAFVG